LRVSTDKGGEVETELALVKQYVALIDTYAILAEDGEPVIAKVEGAVSRACEHFRITHLASAETCLGLFRDELSVRLHATGCQKAQSKAVFESALLLLPKI
jgi:hypothetical protein